MARNTTEATATETTETAKEKKTRELHPRPVYTVLEGDPDLIASIKSGFDSGSLKVVDTTRDQAGIINILLGNPGNKAIVSGMMK